MTEVDPAVSDVAGALVRQLEADAQLVDAGNFTLDPRKAREKLAAYQLAQPERFVLLLVEAAHLLPGCKSIAFTIERRATRVRFEGVELRGDEIVNCFDALFIDAAERQVAGRQKLALAINTALGLPQARVEIWPMSAGEPCLHVMFDAEGRVQTRPESSALTTALVIEVHHAALERDRRAVLQLDARHATVPVRIDGALLEVGSANLLDPIEVRDASGEIIGRVGWCAAQAGKQAGTIALLDNGVVVESYTEPTMPIGALALIDADGLERDLSQSKFRRDEAFLERVSAAAATCEALSMPAPTLGPRAPGIDELIWATFAMLAGLFLLACGFRFGILGTPFYLAGYLSCVWGFNLVRRVVRRWWLQRHGRAGIGVIQSSKRKLGRNFSMMEIELRIERPRLYGYGTRLQLPVEPGFAHLVEPDKRVYVRVDPSVREHEREHVALDHGR